MALVKVVTLFTALWAGVVAAAVTPALVVLHADAVPSLLLVTSGWLVTCWLYASTRSR